METVEPKALRKNALQLRQGDDDSNKENVEKASPYVHLHTPLLIGCRIHQSLRPIQRLQSGDSNHIL